MPRIPVDADNFDPPKRTIKKNRKYREPLKRPWHIILVDSIKELFTPEGINVYQYEDSLEYEIQQDTRYSISNIILSIICIFICFLLVGLIIYYIYIFFFPPIGNDLKDIFKEISEGTHAIKPLKSLHTQIPKDRLEHIKSFDELAFTLGMPGGGEKKSIDCMSMKGGSSNITFNPVPSSVYSPSTQIYNPGIVTNTVDTLKNFGISNNMMKVKIATFFRKFIYNNQQFAVFRLPNEWTTSSFFGSIPHYKLKQLSSQNKTLLNNFLLPATTEADFLF